MDDKSDLVNINVIVADRPYPIRVRPDEEPSVRRAAKEINEKVKEFQQVYAAKDKQDYLAMSALMFVLDNVRNRSSDKVNKSAVEQGLTTLNNRLDTILSPPSSSSHDE